MSGNFRERDTSLRCVVSGILREKGDTFGEQYAIQLRRDDDEHHNRGARVGVATPGIIEREKRSK